MGAAPSAQFWLGKRVLLTGHTGFKGAWLVHWLIQMGAQVTGLSLPPESELNLFRLLDLDRRCDSLIGDIRQPTTVREAVAHARPEVVFHLAAQALVRASYADPITTFSTNVMGTVHLLDALREADSCRVAVMVTTDKVYRNREWIWPYREDDVLGGRDPYSASKSACELAIDSWRQSFLRERGLAVASARAGNVIGGGDWSADRLIPDAVRAWQSGVPLEIRKPNAVRPWQHVLDPLGAYLVLAEKLWEAPSLAGAYNVGPYGHESASVREVIELARRLCCPQGKVVYGVAQGPHEAGLLALDPSLAKAALGVQQHFSLQESVHRTMRWYLSQQDGAAAQDLCNADIKAWREAP